MAKITAYDINHSLWCCYNNYQYRLLNSFVFKWESDFFAVSRCDYIHEVEVKISKSDFKNDFNKTVGYSRIKKHDFLNDRNITLKPNKFWFACPEGLIHPEEIPEKYGLYWIGKSYNSPRVIRNAKFLHKQNLLQNTSILRQMVQKFYYRNIDLKYQLSLVEYDIKYNQKRLYDRTYF